jgi:DNA-directed RNA polymerase specialized sigma24 family protein
MKSLPPFGREAPRSAWLFRGERPDVINRLREIAEHEDLARVAEIADALDEVPAEDESDEIEE